jgi:outer membrane scaffolding protein for murein synthesis (MipA/OmpV family)
VTFIDADHNLDDEVDAAYRAKYRRYAGSILDSVLTPEARSTTIKLVPR